MDQAYVIRHKVLVEKISVRRVARELGVSRNTVRRYVEGATPGVRVTVERPSPVKERVWPRLEQLLAEAPRWTGGKQRLTAARDELPNYDALGRPGALEVLVSSARLPRRGLVLYQLDMAWFAAGRRGRELRRVDGNPHYRPYRHRRAYRLSPALSAVSPSTNLTSIT